MIGPLVFPEETIPKEVYRYLLPSEKRVISVRRNGVVLAPAAGLLMVNVAAFALNAADVIQGGIALLAGLGILFPLSCYVFYRTVRAWLRAYVVVTSARIMLVNVVWKNPLFIIPLAEAYDMTFVHMMRFGRDLSYGSFIFKKRETLGRALKIRYLPYPEQLYIEVCGLLFKDDRDYRVARPPSGLADVNPGPQESTELPSGKPSMRYIPSGIQLATSWALRPPRPVRD